MSGSGASCLLCGLSLSGRARGDHLEGPTAAVRADAVIWGDAGLASENVTPQALVVAFEHSIPGVAACRTAGVALLVRSRWRFDTGRDGEVRPKGEGVCFAPREVTFARNAGRLRHCAGISGPRLGRPCLATAGVTGLERGVVAQVRGPLRLIRHRSPLWDESLGEGLRTTGPA